MYRKSADIQWDLGTGYEVVIPPLRCTSSSQDTFCDALRVCFLFCTVRWMKGHVLTPDPPPHFSVCRTSSILSRDHPPDKKPKSDKASIPPAQDFDSTGNPFYLCLSLSFFFFTPRSSFGFSRPFHSSKWAVVGQTGKVCTVCGLRGELKRSVLLTLTLSSQNGNGCPLFRGPDNRVIAEALTQTVLWFSLSDHKLCICSWPCLLAVWRHYQR